MNLPIEIYEKDTFGFAVKEKKERFTFMPGNKLKVGIKTSLYGEGYVIPQKEITISKKDIRANIMFTKEEMSVLHPGQYILEVLLDYKEYEQTIIQRPLIIKKTILKGGIE